MTQNFVGPAWNFHIMSQGVQFNAYMAPSQQGLKLGNIRHAWYFRAMTQIGVLGRARHIVVENQGLHSTACMTI